MGFDIATALILNDYPVILKEVDENILNAGIDGVKGITIYITDNSVTHTISML